MPGLQTFLLVLALLAAVLVVLRLTHRLPDVSERVATVALPPDASTRFGAALQSGAEQHPNLSAVLPLQGGRDALASRLSLISNAERSIDAQYYIWHRDTSGLLLLRAIEAAARRGVRVRLLVDDNGIGGLDSTLAALNELPQVSVRLINPSPYRRFKYAGFLTSPFRMNRRMRSGHVTAAKSRTTPSPFAAPSAAATV